MSTYLRVEHPEFLIRPYSPNQGFPLDDKCPLEYAPFRELAAERPYGVVLIHDTNGSALFCDAKMAYTHFSRSFTNPLTRQRVTQLFFYVLRSNEKGLVHLATSSSPQDPFIQNYLQLLSGDMAEVTLAKRKMVVLELIRRKKYEEALHFLPKTVLEIAKKSARIACPYLFAGALSFFVPTQVTNVTVSMHSVFAAIQIMALPHEQITSRSTKIYNSLSTVTACCHLFKNLSENYFSCVLETALYGFIKLRENESPECKTLFEVFEEFQNKLSQGSLYHFYENELA